MVVTAAGIDTWSPSWYADPEGAAARWLRERAVLPAKLGFYLPEKILGHRVGWFPAGGLVYAEGHPLMVDGVAELCPPAELVARALDLQDAILKTGLPLPTRERPFESLGPTSEGFAGLRRVDATVNLKLDSAQGRALLAGIAACARDAPGVAEAIWGPSRAVETVYFRGRSGKSVLGRWYDKAVEATLGPRGTLIRGEDQRRWPKGCRRDPEELTVDYVRSQFQRRFYTLYKASKGVTVAGAAVCAVKLAEAAEAGEIGRQQARLLAGDVFYEAHGLSVARPSTLRRSRAARRELGIVLADGVLDEVEVDVSGILEEALDTDAWCRRG